MINLLDIPHNEGVEVLDIDPLVLVLLQVQLAFGVLACPTHHSPHTHQTSHSRCRGDTPEEMQGRYTRGRVVTHLTSLLSLRCKSPDKMPAPHTTHTKASRSIYRVYRAGREDHQELFGLVDTDVAEDMLKRVRDDTAHLRRLVQTLHCM